VKPIVLFFLDQLRDDVLGTCTPHLEAFAREAVRFPTCVTNAPLCRPARLTLMTGQPVHLHGLSTNAVPPPGSQVIGKTHLHAARGHLDAQRARLHEWGFEEALELPDAQAHWVQSAHSDWLGPDKHLRWRDYVSRYTWEAPPPETEPWRLSEEDHLDSFCARAASGWLRRYAEDRPFYLQVNFPGPHPPFDAPAARQPREDPLPSPILEEGSGPINPIWASYARHQRVAPQDWTEARVRALRLRYYAKVSLLDRCVGQVLQTLRETGLYDEAWIVITADHGELLGDHRLTGKVLAYEPSIRIPLLIRPPGGVPGRVEPGATDLLDVVATILAAGGLEPSEPGPAAKSAGLEPVEVDRAVDLRQRVASEGGTHERRPSHVSKTVLFENMGYVGLRTERYTLVWHLGMGRPVELYDRREDPRQLHNLVAEPETGRLVEELRSLRPLSR
jgi:arylsulfatase